jgi:hypothetical protein
VPSADDERPVLAGNRSELVLALVTTLSLIGWGACGSEEQPGTAGADRSTSSPFTVGPVPAGYRQVTAGTGTATPLWGEDSGGTDEPYTVLSPDGTITSPDVVVVSTTGFEGYQGGLGQASAGAEPDGLEQLTVEGEDALYRAAWTDDRGDHWADLVAVRGDDLAVRVTSPDATRDELLEVLARTEVPADRTQAPTVPEPPHGLASVGSVDAGAVVALFPSVQPNTDQVPGTSTAHAVGWVGGEGASDAELAVMTLPAGSVDLDVLPLSERRPWRDLRWSARQVAGRPAMALHEIREEVDPPFVRRAVWVESEWGDMVVVSALGTSAPDLDELAAIASSVRPTDRATWDDLVIEATGGPGLHADEGRTELARGTVGDLEWLLQDAPIRDSGYEPGVEPDDSRVADPCLKLSDRTRACATAGTDGGVEFVLYTTGGGLGFAVVNTTLEAASVRATTEHSEATAPLVPLPDGRSWATVVFIEAPGHALCRPPTAEGPLPTMRLDALDADGQVVGCLGFGPGSHAGGI